MIPPRVYWVLAAAIPIQIACWLDWRWRVRPAIDRGFAVWEAGTGYRITARRRCWFFVGPVGLLRSRSQVIYRLTLIRPDGKSCRADAVVGSWWGGAFWRPDQIKVYPDGPDFTPVPDPKSVVASWHD